MVKSPAGIGACLIITTSVLWIVFGTAACSGESSEPPSAETVERVCDEANLARIEYRGYLLAAKNEAALAFKREERRKELCTVMESSLRATNAYLSGYSRGARLAHHTGIDVVRAYPESLLPSLVDAKIHCNENRSVLLNAFLTRVEREIESDFDRQMAICKKHGWRPVEERIKNSEASSSE